MSPRPSNRGIARASAWLSRLWPARRRSATRQSERRARAPDRAELRAGAVDAGRPGPTDQDATRLAANEGIAALARALDHPDPALRARAVAVICELADTRAREVLKTMILDLCPEVRCAAARSAARVGTTDVVASLIVALTDPDEAVRAAAAEGLSSVTGRRLCTVGPAGVVDAQEIEALKRWWRERRFAEVLRSLVP